MLFRPTRLPDETMPSFNASPPRRTAPVMLTRTITTSIPPISLDRTPKRRIGCTEIAGVGAVARLDRRNHSDIQRNIGTHRIIAVCVHTPKYPGSAFVIGPVE